MAKGTDPLNPEDDLDEGTDPVDTGDGWVKGGGGCDCATADAPPSGLTAGLFALLGALGLSRRRR
ncbi:MAG: MYXO-CTERM sorting domain-containing protein [Deltaproteobacteria bacterium]|nr:MYXO-CTERM sorting domain-containing protein [Deltaproteobacteria bacterium]